MVRILVVDDEERMRRLLKLYLEKEGYEVLEAADGQEALLQAREADLLILDWMLPKGDGGEVCARLRQDGCQLPVLFLTAKGEELDKLTGFAVGGDDYVVKPFSPLEVVARIKALLKRSRIPEEPKRWRRGALTIDTKTHTVTWRKQTLSLTPKEFALLLFLAEHPGQVFSRQQLLDQVWGYSYFGNLRTVDTHIKTLREKAGGGAFLKTVWGVGYSFDDSET